MAAYTVTTLDDEAFDGDLDSDRAPDVTVDADGQSQVLLLSNGTSVIDGLIITGGDAGTGGGIRVDLEY